MSDLEVKNTFRECYMLFLAHKDCSDEKALKSDVENIRGRNDNYMADVMCFLIEAEIANRKLSKLSESAKRQLFFWQLGGIVNKYLKTEFDDDTWKLLHNDLAGICRETDNTACTAVATTVMEYFEKTMGDR